MEPTTEKMCSRCNEVKCQKGFRFCFKCKGIVEKEMSKSNYLTPSPLRGDYRGPGARESTTDTRKGHR